MATFMFRRARRSLAACSPALALAGAALASSSSSPSLQEEAAAQSPEKPDASAPTAEPAEFVGVFVDRASAARLAARFPATVAKQGELFVVLKFHPTEQEKQAFAPLLGQAAALTVKGYVEDARSQAVLVTVTTDGGEPIELDIDVNKAQVPHVTLAAADGLAGANAGQTSVLLERLRAAGRLQFLAAEGSEPQSAAWQGELPAFDSSLLPLFNPFPASSARVEPASKEDAALELRGVVCLSTAYDAESESCAAAKAECGFCKFMKAGPCGAEFSAWESCLDRCKKDGLDFIEHCGKETIALRDCVDANPEYYHVLQDNGEEGEAETEAEAEADKASA